MCMSKVSSDCNFLPAPSALLPLDSPRPAILLENLLCYFRSKPCVLDQQHVSEGGEEGGGGLPVALPADGPRSHRSGPPHGQWHHGAPRDELHSLPAPRDSHPQPPAQLQRRLRLHSQGERGGEDIQDLFHQRHTE